MFKSNDKLINTGFSERLVTGYFSQWASASKNFVFKSLQAHQSMNNASLPPKPKKNRPVVTGISPVEGGPGCKIKIRGEFLGQNQEDIISIKICDIDCTASLEYSTSKCVLTRMGVVERGRPRNIEGKLNHTVNSVK